jgi:hypothetical protein
MPGIMSGQQVDEAIPAGADLKVVVRGRKEPVTFVSFPNIFTDAARLNSRSAVMMHYFRGHPYCRQFAGLLERCWLEGAWRHTQQTVDDLPSVADRLVHIKDQIMRALFINDSETLFRLHQPGQYGIFSFNRFKEQAIATVTDPDLDLVFTHWFVPHQPYIYNRHTNSMYDPGTGYEPGYEDNLELVDSALGDVLKAFDESPVGKNTALIVTADHGAPRKSGEPDTRIIFYLRLPGEEPVRYTIPFTTIALRPLIAGLMSGEINSYRDVEKVLDAYRR